MRFAVVVLFMLITATSSLAQVVASEVVALPAAAAWGGGDTVGSLLIGRTYNAGNGPGVWIVADGGYRLYLNGELLAQDNQAGRVTFVPMTFLPGKNAIAVVGVNGAGAPGVLVQIDELDQSYMSGSGWKASVSVSDNAWKGRNYNDASWSAASYSGNASTLPSGGSLSGFASGSSAQWVWANASSAQQVVLRYSFTIQAEGFGMTATGGSGGTVVVAKDAATIQSELQSSGSRVILVPEGVYDFRKFRNAVTEANAQGRTWCKRACGSSDVNSSNTYYRVAFEANSCASLADGSTPVAESENLQRWDRWITTRADKSLVGMGRGASLRGAAIFMRSNENSSNNIFRNLAIYDVNPHLVEGMDGLSTVGTSAKYTNKFWADHISYKWISDGMDLEYTKEATVSWLDFDGANEYNCWATDPFMALIQDDDLTYANVYWHNTYGRVPKVSSGSGLARVHMYNNYLDYNRFFIVGASGASNSARAEVLYENNYVTGAQSRFTDKHEYGYINWSGNTVADSKAKYYSNDAASSSPPSDAVFSPPYSYVKRTVSNLPTEIPLYAGVGGKWGSMPSYNQSFGMSNQAPQVALTSPADGASGFTSPASLTLTASASDADGSVRTVEFYVGNTLVGTDDSAPYSVTVSQIPAGNYSIVAVATDNSGLKRVSPFVTITVALGNQPPVFSSKDTFFVAENTREVAVLTAADPEGDPIRFGLSSSSDSALFVLDSVTGELTFRDPPDYENPLDNGNNNIFHLMVTASDGHSVTSLKHIVMVTDVDESTPVLLQQNATSLTSLVEVYALDGSLVYRGGWNPSQIPRGLHLVVHYTPDGKALRSQVSWVP